MLEKVGQLSVVELSERFGVSEVTIRADLQALNEKKLIQRVRGGAVVATVLPDLSYEVRKQLNAAKKTRIGKAAAAMIQNGDTIAIDASTTAQAIAPYLKRLNEVTVITNGLKTTMTLLAYPNIHVIMVGGSLRREGLSLIGTLDCGILKEVHIRTGFFGARGFTVEEGMTDVNIGEVKTKRKMVSRCRQVVGVFDASKWGRIATSTFATLDQIDAIITDDEMPVAMIEEVRNLGVEVIVV